MTRKSNMFTKFKEWKAMVELQSGHTLWEFQSDNGGEFISSDFKSYLRSMGILHCTSMAYMPQQNGKAKCSICMILKQALSMLQSVNLSDGFWQDAVGMAVHLINWSTCIGLKCMMPEESWSGTKPDIANLCVFGCTAYMLIPKEVYVGKLVHKSRHCIFIGYSTTWKAWQFWNPVKHSVIESRDIVFNECVQCCSHPVLLVNLSSLKCADQPAEETSSVNTSPVTEVDILNAHQTVNPHLVLDRHDQPNARRWGKTTVWYIEANIVRYIYRMREPNNKHRDRRNKETCDVIITTQHDPLTHHTTPQA